MGVMKRLIALIIIPLLVLGCASKPKDTPLSQAQAAYNQGDYEKAAARLMPLAQNGDAKAQYTLGYMYYYGKGIKRDRTQGYFWIQQSAQQGNKDALKALELLNQEARVKTH